MNAEFTPGGNDDGNGESVEPTSQLQPEPTRNDPEPDRVVGTQDPIDGQLSRSDQRNTGIGSRRR